ncbi:MAG: sigma-54-dependent Fis family transcriptional regulator [Desulfobacteraceae bacterium]|nr:sigma-54-dependent Fis family transcriptional regulator [Desulfobacteraceae bacterium]
MANVLIIDDDKLICELLVKMMKKIGHESRFALTGEDGVDLAKKRTFDIVFLDVNLPDANGLDLIKVFKSVAFPPEIIIITGESDPDGAELAINSGAWNYLEKPFLRQELNLQVSRALQFRKEKGNISTRGNLKTNGIIGDSQEVKSCLDQVSIAANSDTNILISGEQGTGKELFAKTIHLNSDRCENNFVIVDCSAINEKVVESMLFGHRKGAFPGAVSDKTGLVQHADKGTLFLDEVSELPLVIQRSFLRVMEKKVFKPAGDKNEKTTNFRVIATTSYDLNELSDTGKFRKDFLYKLQGINIDLPPLRIIKQDIIKIALFYIDQYCKKYNIDTKGISPEFLDIVAAYEWPGNVRELINAIDKAIASAKNEPMLYSIHLPSYVKAKVVKNSLVNYIKKIKIVEEDLIKGKFPLVKVFLRNKEKEYLTALLSHVDGDIKKASKIAGLSQSSIYTKLKKYSLR